MKNLLAAFLVSALIMQTSALAYDETFSDVSESNSHFVAIEYLVNIGTLEGYDDGTFKPSQTINRAELMKVLVAGQGIDPDPDVYNNCYPDVNDEWFAKYVCYADAMDWVDGYPTGFFLPAQTINKAEAAKMVVNAYDLGGSDNPSEFDDVSEDDWFYPYVTTLSDIGAVETGGDYEPAEGMNRGLTAEYIFRILVLQGMWEEFYTEDIRDEFLEMEGMGDLVGSSSTGDDDDDDTSDEVLHIDMDVEEMMFMQEDIYTVKGQTIEITFSHVIGEHTFTIDEIGLDEDIEEGDTITFEAPWVTGDYEYYCIYHYDMGMYGTMHVQPE